MVILRLDPHKQTYRHKKTLYTFPCKCDIKSAYLYKSVPYKIYIPPSLYKITINYICYIYMTITILIYLSFSRFSSYAKQATIICVIIHTNPAYNLFSLLCNFPLDPLNTHGIILVLAHERPGGKTERTSKNGHQRQAIQAVQHGRPPRR